MVGWKSSRIAHQRGQALLETVIVLPVMIFLILGALQLMMIQHGRIMTEYAAYNAARAGVVHNANWNVMRNAALISSLPLYDRTDTPGRFLETWAKVKLAAEITEAVDSGTATLERLVGDLIGIEISGVFQDLSLIEVNVLHPDQAAFAKAQAYYTAQESAALSIDPKGGLRYPDDEIDFDDLGMMKVYPELSRLELEVRVLYPLRIPLVNKIIFDLWLAQILLNARRVESTLEEWAQWRGRIRGSSGDGRALDTMSEVQSGSGPLDDFFTTTQWTKEVRTLQYVADRFGLYFLPLYAHYNMSMQSNMFETNRREPVWFSLD